MRLLLSCNRSRELATLKPVNSPSISTTVRTSAYPLAILSSPVRAHAAFGHQRFRSITPSALLRTARCSHSLRSSKPAGDSRSQSATIFARSYRDWLTSRSIGSPNSRPALGWPETENPPKSGGDITPVDCSDGYPIDAVFMTRYLPKKGRANVHSQPGKALQQARQHGRDAPGMER
jgi:hypothetical protein